MTALLILI